MKLVCISDTHGQHQKLVLPKGDILIHAGDVSRKGDYLEVVNFLNWFGKQNFKYKIFIAGNHDFYFEQNTNTEIEKLLPQDVYYLNDSAIEIEGINFWGSPITPWFYDWAFNRNRGEDILKHWNLIPNNTDVLITHGPMFNLLDKTATMQNVGCQDLYNCSQKLNLKAHICGHIHEAYGTIQHNNTQFLNASVLNIKYELVNKPLVIEV